MKDSRKQHSLPMVAALLVFAVFATGVLSVLMGGTGIYRRLTQRSRQSFDSRTCVQYLASRIRQTPGDVAVAPFGEGDALLLTETIGSQTYVTRIYCHDGWLMELFTSMDAELRPQDGQKILPASGLSLRLEGSLLTAFLTPKACDPVTLRLFLRSQKEARP